MCAILKDSVGAGTENIQPIVAAQDIQRILQVLFEKMVEFWADSRNCIRGAEAEYVCHVVVTQNMLRLFF